MKVVCHNCDTKPVLAAKTDFIDGALLLIPRNLLKTGICSKIPAYRLIRYIFNQLQAFSGDRQLELFRRGRRLVLLHRPRTGPAPMGRRRHVSTDRHAAAPRRRAAQLPADGMVAGSRDSRGGSVTSGWAHPLLRHVDPVRGPRGELHPSGRAPLDETVTFVDDSALAPRASELEQTNHLHLSQNHGMVGLTRYDGQV